MAVQDELRGFASDELEYLLRHVFGLVLTPENGKSLKTVGDLHAQLERSRSSPFLTTARPDKLAQLAVAPH